MNNQTLESTLINALTKLQYADFDKEFLREKDQPDPDLIAEQHFAFSIGRHRFVVKASCFCEVFVDIPIALVPNSPALLRGLCNVRSLLVPVFQLHARLGCSPPTKTYVFCIGRGEKTIGLLIDELPVSIGLSGRERVAEDSRIEDDSLNLLVKQTYRSRQVLRYLLDGDLLGEQLLVMANSAKQENFAVAPGPEMANAQLT